MLSAKRKVYRDLDLREKNLCHAVIFLSKKAEIPCGCEWAAKRSVEERDRANVVQCCSSFRLRKCAAQYVRRRALRAIIGAVVRRGEVRPRGGGALQSPAARPPAQMSGDQFCCVRQISSHTHLLAK